MTLDAVLQTQQSGGTPPRSLDELKALATEMAKYYLIGFGNALDGILVQAEAFYRLENGKEKRIQWAYEELKRIEFIYAEIPFNSLEGKGDFKPLFEVRDRLPILRRKMDELFVVKNEAGLGDLKSFVQEVANIGLQYKDNLMQTLNQIRSFSEAKDFRVPIKDRRNGVIYQF